MIGLKYIVPSFSVPRLGDFLKFLVTNFHGKEPKIFNNVLGYLQKHLFLRKNCYCNFLDNF